MNVFQIKLPTFTEHAACREANPELFFPHEGANSHQAKAICAECPVSTACLDYAMTYEEEHPGSRWGIYGGTTPRQRRTIAAKQRKSA